MDLAAVEALVARGESDRLEFKRSTAELTSAGRTLCGFLNHRGGTVLVGVTSQGQIVGQDISDMTQQTVANALRLLDPPAPVAFTIAPVAGTGAGQQPRGVIALSVDAIMSNQPYLYDGRGYVRVGTTTALMGRERQLRTLLDRVHPALAWELQPAASYAIADLDAAAIQNLVRVGRDAGRIPFGSEPVDVADALTRMHLLRDGRLTNAAVVMFAREMSAAYTQCRLRLARFRGTDKREFVREQPPIVGNVLTVLAKASAFLEEQIPRTVRITRSAIRGALQRQETPALPLRALREAVINAVCHRDYAVRAGQVTVAMYDDRVEIANPGHLPDGWTAETLKVAHPSLPPNPTLAGVLYDGGYIERWGRGTVDMVALCRERELPDPEFVVRAGEVVVVFRLAHPFALTAVPGHVEAGGKAAPDVLPPRQRVILTLLRSGPLSTSALESQVRTAGPRRVARRTLNRDLAALQRRGLVTADGVGRAVERRLTHPSSDVLDTRA